MTECYPARDRIIIGFAGLHGSGKDTCAEVFVQDLGFVKRAFAHPVKTLCQDIFSLSDEQLWGSQKDKMDERYGLSARQIMQRFATDFVRNTICKTFWIENFERWLDQTGGCGSISGVVVPDVRFQNEVDLIRRLGGRVYLIRRPSLEEDGRAHHASEMADNLSHLSGAINNDCPIEELRIRVRSLIPSTPSLP